MSDRKQSAVSRRLDKASKDLIDTSIANVSSTVTDLSNFVTEIDNTVTDLSTTVTDHDLLLNPEPYIGNYTAGCYDLTIDVNQIRTNLNGGFLIDPNIGTGYPIPSVNAGQIGYWTTYTFTCASATNQEWSIGDSIKLTNYECEIDALIQTYNKTTGEFQVRIYYPLSSLCNGSAVNGWTLSNPKSQYESHFLCCATPIDGGWCPINIDGSPDLTTLWENVILGGLSDKRLGIPDISGGYS